MFRCSRAHLRVYVLENRIVRPNEHINCTSKDIYTINYENLIDNQNFEIKKLINFCGLKWDPSCLNPQNNSSPIKTASILQARKTIYSSSKNSIDNYSIYLKAVFELLDNNK